MARRSNVTKIKHPQPGKQFKRTQAKKDREALKKKIEVLIQDLKRSENEKKALSESQSLYISMLANFASHDLKNAIQSMDNILFVNTSKELTIEHMEALQKHLSMMRESMDNFSELAPHSKESKIDVESLINTVVSINKDNFRNSNIECYIENETTISFHAGFHAVAGMINNIILNAINALKDINKNERKILISYGYDDIESLVWFGIYDNAREIPLELREKIFDYGFTTSDNGSGIGLYHVRDICSVYNGSIVVKDSDIEGYTKYFYIEIPVEDRDE